VRTAFIGTCRVLDPANHLRRDLRLPALHTAHRVHSPREVERLVEALTTGKVDPLTVHTISDAAFADLLQGRSEWTAEFIGLLHAQWDTCSAFVIEISTLKQSFVETGVGRLYVNHYTLRDLQAFSEQIEPMIQEGKIAPFRAADIVTENVTASGAHAAMRRIKALLGGRPIVWACHLNVVSQSEETRRLHEVRTKIASIVASGAEKLGDRFYDPTEVLTELGAKNALEKNGTDYNHFSRPAIERLAKRYWQIATDLKGTAPASETV
jgi:hypothetical protein